MFTQYEREWKGVVMEEKQKENKQKANTTIVCLQKNTSIIIVNLNDIIISKDKDYLNGF